MKRIICTLALLLGALQTSQAGVTCTWLYDLEYYSYATLVQDSHGTLYGTTVGSNATGGGWGEVTLSGTLFYATTNGPSHSISFPVTSIPGITNFWTFPPTNPLAANLGEMPYAGVVLGPGQSVLGTTAFYGNSNTLFTNGMGCVYGFFTNNPSPRYYRFGSVLNSHGQPLDGASPRATLAVASNNYLYGTTFEGGSNGYSGNGSGYGTVFKLSTNSSGSILSLTELHSFAGTDGANPTGLTFGADGYLYGVAAFGGSNTSVVETNGKTGFGTIYRIDTNGVLNVLYSFGTITNTAGNALDGSQPNPLLQGTDGNFYGTTAYGGSNTTVVDSLQDVGYGTFFQITTNGVLTPLYSFGSVTNFAGVPLDGGNPSGPLVQGVDGNFYGTTACGGPTNTGTVFRMSPQGVLTTLYACGTNSGHTLPSNTGENPRAGLLIAADGGFYGTTYTGGVPEGASGAIFRLGPAAPTFSNAPAHVTIPAGATYIFPVEVNSIYETACQWQFDETNLADGGNVSGSASPNLTISAATLADSGTYTLVASNAAGVARTSGVLTVVPALIVRQPASATILAGASNTFSVGINSILAPSFQWQFNGTSLSDGGNISGSATSNLTILGATTSETGAYSVIIINAAGTTNCGAYLTVLEPFSYGVTLNTLYSFVGANDGASPEAALLQAGDGNFYGTTWQGGADGWGTVFRMTPSGSNTTLYSFGASTNDAGNPTAALIEGADGNLYGTTRDLPSYIDGGSIFSISLSGGLTTMPFRNSDYLSWDASL